MTVKLLILLRFSFVTSLKLETLKNWRHDFWRVTKRWGIEGKKIQKKNIQAYEGKQIPLMTPISGIFWFYAKDNRHEEIYRPVTILTIFSKTFERCIYVSLRMLIICYQNIKQTSQKDTLISFQIIWYLTTYLSLVKHHAHGFDYKSLKIIFNFLSRIEISYSSY